MPFGNVTFLDPKSDLVFKKIFGNRKYLLKSLLNGLLPIKNPIKDLEYLQSKQVPVIPTMKRGIVDVKFTDSEDLYWNYMIKF